MMFALAGLAAAALVLLIVAIGVTIWLYRCREQRRTDGKTNVGWIVFLVIAYLLSISYLAFFVLLRDQHLYRGICYGGIGVRFLGVLFAVCCLTFI